MKRQSTLAKEQLVRDLTEIDNKLKFTNSLWNDTIKATFAETGSYCFEDMVRRAKNTSTNIVNQFKPLLKQTA